MLNIFEKHGKQLQIMNYLKVSNKFWRKSLYSLFASGSAATYLKTGEEGNLFRKRDVKYSSSVRHRWVHMIESRYSGLTSQKGMIRGQNSPKLKSGSFLLVMKILIYVNHLCQYGEVQYSIYLNTNLLIWDTSW